MSDAVKSPSHYTRGGMECADALRAMMAAGDYGRVAEASELNPYDPGLTSVSVPPMGFYWLGCAFKYLWRWRWKGGRTDLEKCRRCVELLIEECYGEEVDGGVLYNLYSLYEAVLGRRPINASAIGNDEVEKLVDALIDICNAPGREVIARADAAPDRGELLKLADRLDKDADNIISAARNARFTGGGPRMGEAKHDACEWRCIARRIREALGVDDG
ncbi:hypothetical protein [Candidatus Collinsella stercoripullorum]|uniref:hypothetical protein n=1 Tax=Candidatus Collinsella stercoripullorum TaxID=2838522 RepID=UPI0022E716A4|nr:hypothetical protein [Candidatus Collinsella stercoripullorum]